VAGFSVGLAITLVSVGVLAAWGAGRARAGWSGFSVWAERIPYISAGIVALIGAIVTFKGLSLLGLV
jgi:nickel/cobalt exporter